MEIITKARLIQKINNAFHRTIETDTTDLDELITDALVELSIRGDFLHNESEITTAENTYIYNLPEDFKGNLTVSLDENYQLGYWHFYRMNRYYAKQDPDDLDTGTPKKYSWKRAFAEGEQQNLRWLYLKPAPNDNDGDNYTLRLHYNAYHPRKITVGETTYDACDYILFSEEFESLLKNLILARWAGDKNLDTDEAKYEFKFERMLQFYLSQVGTIFRKAKYYDFA